MRWCVPFLLLALPLPDLAAAAPPIGIPDPPVLVRLTYDGYASGFHVLDIVSDLSLGPEGYQIAMAGHTAGVVGVVYHARWRTVTAGGWSADGLAPTGYDNAGVFGGQPRHIVLSYQDGDPVVRMLEPADDQEHAPVPPGTARQTIDGLSVLALAIREIAATGTCAGAFTTFDGRTIEARVLHSPGVEDLPPTSRSSFQGPAVRCDMRGRVLAGFLHDTPVAAQENELDTMWFARVLPGAPPLPVRMSAVTHHIGRTVLYLTGATLEPQGAVAGRER